jgi:adenosylcobyric acid synthase
MVCGTSSGAGKSFLVTALARWYSRQGFRVAPFKAQNMSNNARVVAQGEIGSAQYFQALAAGCVPDVRMNPVLLKPESDTRSQVIVLGARRDDLAAIEWRARTHTLWPIVQASLEELLAMHDVVVIEGAGSPAEINLQPTDIVNMRVAAAARAATLIVCDVDRGGAFAHLFGTFQLLPHEHRALIRGFVLNRFRGDAGLLAPAPQMLETLTGVPTLAVLPLWRGHGLPEEDGVFDSAAPPPRAAVQGLHVVIVAYPAISNLDEFAPLGRVAGLRLTWARDARAMSTADLLILPGSKHVAGDLEWLRARGMDVEIARHLARNGPTLAVCGGLQMLGREIMDPHGVEGAATGLDLLPYSTTFAAHKLYRRASHTFKRPTGFWSTLDGVEFAGYEIRHGQTRVLDEIDTPRLVPVLEDHCGWQSGETLAIYVHGLFETPEVMRRLFGRETPTLDDTLDGLADFIDRHFEAGVLESLLNEP